MRRIQMNSGNALNSLIHDFARLTAFSVNYNKFYLILFAAFFFSIMSTGPSYAKSFDLAINNSGVSFGNSKRFNGLRINFCDSEVEKINGVNVTIWETQNNKNAVVNGISLGLWAPGAGYLKGIQIGGIGVKAEKELKGISLAPLGVGSGGDISGITIGGLGTGAGGDIKGITVGLFGVGAGGDMTGVCIGGFGAGAGGDITGINIGGFGTGAGGNITGISIGGLGAGAGGDIKGVTLGLLGAGAGGNMTGITFGGLGAGCGNTMKGIAIGGLGVGAPRINGFALALGYVKVNDEGFLRGFSAGAFNQVKGKLTGVSLGIYNCTYELNGVQIGLINYVRDNPKYMRILPLINVNFD